LLEPQWVNQWLFQPPTFVRQRGSNIELNVCVVGN
jgi:hypothetical protein